MKTITENQYFHALALYMLARRKQAEVDKLQEELGEVLMLDEDAYVSHIDDAIYDCANTGTRAEFDSALKLMGYSAEV